MDPKTVSLVGAIIVSVVALLTFTGALIVAFFKPDLGLLQLTVGAAIANATTAVGFWLGSSSGSQKKDDVISAALRASSGAAPVVTAINPRSGGVGGGTTVTVTGSGFTGATSVQFGTNNATAVTVVSDTQITATSPPGTSAVARITNPTSAITNVRRTPDPLQKATQSFIFQAQAALCVPKTEIDGTLNSATIQNIRDYLRATDRPIPEKIDPLALQPFLANAVQNVPNCAAAGFENPYEVAKFGIPSDRTSHKITNLQTNLLNFLKLNGSNIGVEATGNFDQKTREGIAEARRIAIDKKLLPPTDEGDQIDEPFNLFIH